jgi:hypothetical protein
MINLITRMWPERYLGCEQTYAGKQSVSTSESSMRRLRCLEPSYLTTTMNMSLTAKNQVRYLYHQVVTVNLVINLSAIRRF